MTVVRQNIQVDESGAGSVGIQQYINQISKRLVLDFNTQHTGSRGNKIARTIDSIRNSKIQKPDIFWATAPSLALSFASAAIKVLTVHDLRPFVDSHGDSRIVTIYRRIAYAAAIRSADRIICVSQRTLTDLTDLFPKSKSKSSVIPLSGERTGNFTYNSVPQSSLIVCVIAHEHNKQAHRVLPAILFLDPDIQIKFLCGRHTANWHDEVDAVRNAHIIGFLPDDQYVRAISQSSTVIMLSSFEGFGIPIVEAQRLGVPVVISDDKALLEVSTPDATVVRATDSPEQIATAIMQSIAKSGKELRPGPYDFRSWDEVVKETTVLLGLTAT